MNKQSLFTSDFIGAVILAVFIAIAFGFALVGCICFYMKLVTGWKALTRRFPAADLYKFGGKYERQDGYFNLKRWRSGELFTSLQGGIVFTRQFTIEIAREGLAVTARFARRSPILIPWSDIHDVAVGDVAGNIVTVNYEKEVRFSIPNEALSVIQENVPTERLHKGMSLSELIEGRLNPPQT